MAGKEKNKAAGKETPAASESVQSSEVETDDALAMTVTRIQDLVNNTLKEIEVLGQQVRAQWSFLKNINTSNPKQSFFPRLKPRTAEETQDKTRKTTPEAVTI